MATCFLLKVVIDVVLEDLAENMLCACVHVWEVAATQHSLLKDKKIFHGMNFED